MSINDLKTATYDLMISRSLEAAFHREYIDSLTHKTIISTTEVTENNGQKLTIIKETSNNPLVTRFNLFGAGLGAMAYHSTKLFCSSVFLAYKMLKFSMGAIGTLATLGLNERVKHFAKDELSQLGTQAVRAASRVNQLVDDFFGTAIGLVVPSQGFKILESSVKEDTSARVKEMSLLYGEYNLKVDHPFEKDKNLMLNLPGQITASVDSMMINEWNRQGVNEEQIKKYLPENSVFLKS